MSLSRRRMPELEDTAEVIHSFFGLLLVDGHFLTPFNPGGEVPAQLVGVSALVPLAPAADARTDQAGNTDLWLIASHELALVTDSLDPVDRFRDRPGGDELSIGAINDEGVPPFVGIQKQLTILSVHGQVEQHALVSGIPVPDVMGHLLKVPLQFSGIRV